MNNNHERTLTHGSRIGVWVLVVCLMVTTAGCQSLKKKFTRKKKSTAPEEEFIPVLEPEVYPEKVETNADLYRYHYSLWQVWDRELKTNIADGDSDKRKLYTLEQMVGQLQNLLPLLPDDKKPGLEAILRDMQELKKKLQQPSALRDEARISKQLDQIGRKVRDGYKFSLVQDHLK